MKRPIRYVVPGLLIVLSLAGFVSASSETGGSGEHGTLPRNSPPPCRMAMTRALYGFQCHGSSFTGSTLEQVTFVGTVRGNGRGFFEGFGTFNSGGGSAATHVAGEATLLPSCFGHVDYTTNEILLPNGATVPLPPVSFDYVVVDSGKEILGTGVAPRGIQGDQVPRLTCRLVRVD